MERRCGLGEDTQFTCSSGGATAAQRTLEDSDGSGSEAERVGPNFYFFVDDITPGEYTVFCLSVSQFVVFIIFVYIHVK